MPPESDQYRGRLAPSPTGCLHIGHARTFALAQRRAIQAGGTVVLRNDDLDCSRVRPEYVSAMYEDLRWLGLHWQEGPDVGGPFAPYTQSERLDLYRAAFDRLKAAELIYPCTCSRQDVLRAIQAPHLGEEEPLYPGTCRNRSAQEVPRSGKVNWRFRIPAGCAVRFEDGAFGPQEFVSGEAFGDFVVWRHDSVPAYQLACVVDDAEMRMTEVVRGADLLLSTARQLLLYEALRCAPPHFYHAPLITDPHGIRLAKRHDALSIQALRRNGWKPEEVLDPERVATFYAANTGGKTGRG